MTGSRDIQNGWLLPRQPSYSETANKPNSTADVQNALTFGGICTNYQTGTRTLHKHITSYLYLHTISVANRMLAISELLPLQFLLVLPGVLTGFRRPESCRYLGWPGAIISGIRHKLIPLFVTRLRGMFLNYAQKQIEIIPHGAVFSFRSTSVLN